MLRHHLHRALAVAGVLALTSAAAAQSPHAAAPARANAAPEAHHADKPNGDDKRAKPDDAKGAATTPASAPGAAAAKTDAPKDDAQKSARHAERVKTEHDAERAKLAALLHAPIDDATREELKRHARRVARIERIKALATEAKDDDASSRASKLLDKENARHDKWMTNAAATAQAGQGSKGGAR